MGRGPPGPGSYRVMALSGALGAVLGSLGPPLLLLLLEPPAPRPPPHGPRGRARCPHPPTRHRRLRVLPGCSSRTPAGALRLSRACRKPQDASDKHCDPYVQKTSEGTR